MCKNPKAKGKQKQTALQLNRRSMRKQREAGESYSVSALSALFPQSLLSMGKGTFVQKEPWRDEGKPGRIELLKRSFKALTENVFMGS